MRWVAELCIIYIAWQKSSTQDTLQTNPATGRMDGISSLGLNPGSLAYQTGGPPPT